jgi:hypothetical protein
VPSPLDAASEGNAAALNSVLLTLLNTTQLKKSPSPDQVSGPTWQRLFRSKMLRLSNSARTNVFSKRQT